MIESLVIRNIRKVYDTDVVLDDISLKVNASETVVILGPSGCGKTTLLKLINRLTEADEGEILIDGENNKAKASYELRRNIGYVIQDVGLLPHLSVKQNIELVRTVAGETLTPAQLSELIELTGLSDSLLERSPAALSGGQQQRVGIARALANDPSIILMDEPFSALDTITRNQLQDDFLLHPILRQKTIIMVTHDIQEAFKLADRIILLNGGIIQQVGSPNEFLTNPANNFVKSFLEKDELILRIQLARQDDRTLSDFLKDPDVASEEKLKALAKIFNGA